MFENNDKVGMIVVENSVRIKYKVLHVNIDSITLVAGYANAIPITIPMTYFIENYEPTVKGGQDEK